MRQIPLALLPEEAPSFENFVPGANVEALAALRALAGTSLSTTEPWSTTGMVPLRPAGHTVTPPTLYLWGESGSGRSHLARAFAAAASSTTLLLDPAQPLAHFDPAGVMEDGAVVIDDCDQLDAARQEAAFHLFNRVRAEPGARFLATGGQPPAGLALRDDLRTRLGWGAVLRLAPLSDDDKAEALRNAAHARGSRLPDALLRYLLARHARDIRSLLATVAALDQYALEHKRALTIPLLHDFERFRGSRAAHC